MCKFHEMYWAAAAHLVGEAVPVHIVGQSCNVLCIHGSNVPPSLQGLAICCTTTHRVMQGLTPYEYLQHAHIVASTQDWVICMCYVTPLLL